MDYHTPNSLDDALRLVGGGDTTVIAGGTDVYPSLSGRDLVPPVVDISGIDALRGLHRTDGGLRIGALTSWCDVRTADLPPAFDALRSAAKQVGGVQIQNAGTIAGNLCNASPAADGVPPLLCLDAAVELSSVRATRTLQLSDFLLGARRTARAPDEVLTAIVIPEQPEGATSSFCKLGARRYLVISIAMVAALLRRDADGRIAEARIAVGACSPVAQRLRSLEADLVGQDPSDPQVTDNHLSLLSPITDPRGTADYRHRAVRELCLRAIRNAGGARG